MRRKRIFAKDRGNDHFEYLRAMTTATVQAFRVSASGDSAETARGLNLHIVQA